LRCSVPNTGIAPSPGLSRERIITGILQPYADRPGAALDILKKLRILIRHAINVGWLKHTVIRHQAAEDQKKFGHGLMTKLSNSKNVGRSAPNSARHFTSSSIWVSAAPT
jgi:hypothetical protein